MGRGEAGRDRGGGEGARSLSFRHDGGPNDDGLGRVRLERSKRKLTHSHTYIDSLQIRLVFHFHPLNGEQKNDVFEFSKELVEIDK